MAATEEEEDLFKDSDEEDCRADCSKQVARSSEAGGEEPSSAKRLKISSHDLAFVYLHADDNDTPNNGEDEQIGLTRLFQSRWEVQDRAYMLGLMKQGEVACYGWNRTAMETALPVESRDLEGTYDIVFVHAVPGATDQGSSDGPISRTTRGTLNLFSKTIRGKDYYYAEGTHVMYGEIQLESKSVVREEEPGVSVTWEYGMQMDNVEFREMPPGYFGDDGVCFCLLKNEGCDSADEYQVSIHVLTNSGRLDWIPDEQETSSEVDRDYAQFMRNQLARRLQGDVDWKPEFSWMCNHLGLPATVAWNVQSFLQSRLPSIEWGWQEGDLLVQLNPVEYATYWETFYLARRRSKATRS